MNKRKPYSICVNGQTYTSNTLKETKKLIRAIKDRELLYYTPDKPVMPDQFKCYIFRQEDCRYHLKYHNNYCAGCFQKYCIAYRSAKNE